MKKLVSFVTTLAVILTMSLTPLAASPNMDSINPSAGKGNTKKVQTTTSSNCYGRLVIESVGIDVALYNDNSQATCDAVDSACFYSHKGVKGMTIVDHNYQAFRPLTNVTVGTTAVIYESNGGKIYLECVDVTNGQNTKYSLIYPDGSSATGRSDYLTYTCLDNKGNIRICQWNIVGTENINSKYEKQFNIDNSTTKKVTKGL